MNNEVIASVLAKISKITPFNILTKSIYRYGIKKLVSKIKKINGVTLFLKSDLDSKRFQFGISDLDFLVIIKEEKNRDKIRDIILELNKIYPFIKDIDIFFESDIELLIKYGKYKYRGHKKWEKVYGNYEIKGTYQYYPIKFFIEQLHELFFALDWLAVNFEKNKKKKTYYRKQALERVIVKIYSIVHWIEEPNGFLYETYYETYSEDLKSLIQDVCENHTLESISRFLSRKSFSYYNEILPVEFDWYEKLYEVSLDESGRELFKLSESLHVYRDENEKISTKLNISQNLFELFIKLGCLHVDVLINAAINTFNPLNRSFINMLCYTFILEGHTSNVKVFDEAEVESVSKDLEGGLSLNSEKPINISQETVYITVNWGSDRKRKDALSESVQQMKQQSVKLQWFHFDVTFDGHDELEKSDINVIQVRGNNNNKELWLKECLYNLAAGYCFGAKSYIFADADIYSNDLKWIEEFNLMLNSEDYDFVHGFSRVTDTDDESYNVDSWTKAYFQNEDVFHAPGLVWGLPARTYKELRYIPDILPDGSNDGAFLQELTSVPMGVVSKYHWYNSRIRTHNKDFKISYVDKEVVHINHGPPRDYVNRVSFLDLLAVDFENLYKKNHLGLYEWTKASKGKQALELAMKYHQYAPENIIKMVDLLVTLGVMRLPKKLIFWGSSNKKERIEVTNGIAIFYRDDNGDMIILTSSCNTDAKIEIICEHFELMDNEHVFAHYEVEKPKGVEVNAKILYDWWEMDGVRNLYSSKFYKNQTIQPMAICFSSWDDHIHLFFNFLFEHQKGAQKYKIRRNKSEHINFFHTWKELFVEKILKENFHKIGKSIIVNLPTHLASGWHLIEARCFGDAFKCKLTICTRSDLEGIASSRIYNSDNGAYMKVGFHNLFQTKSLCLKIEGVETDIDFENIEVKLHERKSL